MPAMPMAEAGRRWWWGRQINRATRFVDVGFSMPASWMKTGVKYRGHGASMNIMDNAIGTHASSLGLYAGAFYHGNHLIHEALARIAAYSTTIQSMTVVLLSPRFCRLSSRIKGGSPVIALSSTPRPRLSITSSSAEICSPAFIQYHLFQFCGFNLCDFIFWPADGILDAIVSFCPPWASCLAFACPLRLPRQSCRTVR